jgi:hypothetical protein
MGHISYRYNHYSVPWEYATQEVDIRCNGSLIRVFKDEVQIALHSLSHDSGGYITTEAHKPPYKQSKSELWYREQMDMIGPKAVRFLESLKKERPRHWHKMIKGVLSLARKHDPSLVERSCQRALEYGALSYREVKGILDNKLYDIPPEPLLSDLGGHGQELSLYDQLTN